MGSAQLQMYGGGMAMPRKPMMMGGLAEKNRTQSSAMPKAQDAMGMMTQDKFGMGYNLGGAIKKDLKRKAMVVNLLVRKKNWVHTLCTVIQTKLLVAI